MTSLLVDPPFLLTFWLNAKARKAEKLSKDNFPRGDKSECSHNDGFDVIKLLCGLKDESGIGLLFWKAAMSLDSRLAYKTSVKTFVFCLNFSEWPEFYELELTFRQFEFLIPNNLSRKRVFDENPFVRTFSADLCRSVFLMSILCPSITNTKKSWNSVAKNFNWKTKTRVKPRTQEFSAPRNEANYEFH